MKKLNLNTDKLFFTSDTHFGHKNIIEYCNRPFKDQDEMDERLIANWNSVVPPDGTVFHLGDVSFRKLDHTLAILYRLNGAIHLIRGNHDRQFKATKRFDRFTEIVPYKEISVEGEALVLSHFPIHSWNQQGHGAWHLHGHSHGSLRSVGKRLDVGVDCFNYTPVSFQQLKEIMKLRKVEVVDYHKNHEATAAKVSS